MEGNLKWAKHVSNLQSKLKIRLAGLNSLKYVCQLPARKMFAQGIFSSVIVYCLPVFGGMQKCLMQDLQLLQNKAARMVCKSPPRAPRIDLFKQLNWLTINQLVAYHTLIMIFKIRKCKEPEYLAYSLGPEGRNGRIRSQNPFLSIAADSFCYRGPSLWNKLPEELRTSTKIGSFKRNIKKWIVNNVPHFII